MNGQEREKRRREEREKEKFPQLPFSLSPLLLVLLALALRLLVWRWREPYPLGGDETEYFNQAIMLLRDHQYTELRLMRPPLYTVFLAGSIAGVDSAVQNLRLVQAVISALTVLPVYALAWQLFHSRRVAFVAGLLFALNYTLAAAASELLTETVFVFGLSVALWLLVKAQSGRTKNKEQGTKNRSPYLLVSLSPCLLVALAGLTIGALALVRSVALPLVGLGALWLWFASSAFGVQSSESGKSTRWFFGLQRLVLPIVFVVSALVVILPWTTRNYLVYGAPILIDTTGAENLWLDNNPAAATPADPLGREAAKAALYALGDDRAARQSLATRRGTEAIRDHPVWFAQKAWGEAKKFFALQYFDELREKRAIWVSPAEVWAKLLLGDGLWLVIVFGGIIGLTVDGGWWMVAQQPFTVHRPPSTVAVRWLFVLWVLYIFATSLLFHVELRYRLPVYPVLVPFAALILIRKARRRESEKTGKQVRVFPFRLSPLLLVSLPPLLLVGVLTLLHRPYPAETWMLANKHVALWQAEQALAAGDGQHTQQAAQTALGWDDTSALARVALARAALLAGDESKAESELAGAIAALNGHPQAHLLRGALLRRSGNEQAARTEFAYETGSLQDLQTWSWNAFRPLGPPPVQLAIGAGLDLGFVRGFYPTENGYRWTMPEAHIQLAATPETTAVELEVAPGRPNGTAPASLRVFAGANEIGTAQLRDGWQTVRFRVQPTTPIVELTLRSTTFRPRDSNRASADNRELGVMVRRVGLVVP